jgi:hypothetical protein
MQLLQSDLRNRQQLHPKCYSNKYDNLIPPRASRNLLASRIQDRYSADTNGKTCTLTSLVVPDVHSHHQQLTYVRLKRNAEHYYYEQMTDVNMLMDELFSTSQLLPMLWLSAVKHNCRFYQVS